MKKAYNILPIGYVRNSEQDFYLEILEPYRAALKHLNKFSHVHIYWWAHKNDNDNSRSIMQVNPPYSNEMTGIFATRAEYRPNPICETICPILDIDEANGKVVIPWIDAFPETPIIDLKAYFPICDRVKNSQIAPWLKDWPEWYEDAAEWAEAQKFDE